MDISFITDWLLDGFTWLVAALYNAIVDLINLIIIAIGGLIGAVVAALPSGGIIQPSTAISGDWLGYVNWIVPFTHMVQSLVWYGTALLLFLLSAPMLRWIKIVK